MITNLDFFKILEENLTIESRWFLVILKQREHLIHKNELRRITNEEFVNYEKRKGKEVKSSLITSRHVLDTHLSRLEGAGLLTTKDIGMGKLYGLSEFGKLFTQYLSSKEK